MNRSVLASPRISYAPIVHIRGPLSMPGDAARNIYKAPSDFMDMNTFKSRLFDAAQHVGVEWGQTPIGDSLGIHKQTVDRWFKGGEPSMGHLVLISRKWGINGHWLLLGDGEMLPSEKHISSETAHHKDLQEIQSAWDTLSPKQRQTLKETLLDLAGTIARANSTRGPVAQGVSDARSRGAGKRPKDGQSPRRHSK